MRKKEGIGKREMDRGQGWGRGEENRETSGLERRGDG